jgi:hypothetical protein
MTTKNQLCVEVVLTELVQREIHHAEQSARLEMHPDHEEFGRKVNIAALHLLPEDRYGRCFSNLFR